MRKKLIIGGAMLCAILLAGIAYGQITNGVPNAKPAVGTQSNALATGYHQVELARGSDLLENPQAQHTTYGYVDNNADPNLRTRTEPDQNTYLHTTNNPGGPTPNYDYGRHFLIQGHENGGNKAYFTRINLDVTDPAHRITLLDAAMPDGTTGLSSIDGSVYDPFNDVVLFTQESGNTGHVFQTPFHWSSTSIPAVQNLDGSMGQAGYEGVVPDSKGEIYLVEDSSPPANVTDPAGGPGGTPLLTAVKRPYSFVFRFVPDNLPSGAADLTHGKLQVLQIVDNGTPITVNTSTPTNEFNDTFGQAYKDLHSGQSLTAHFVTVHDTTVDGTSTFDANALAKTPLGTHTGNVGTPLKRPENGKFIPGSGFKSYVFTETGDTNSVNAGNYTASNGQKAQDRASWGALVRLDLPSAGANDGTVKTIELGDASHASPDNITFFDKNTMFVAEDRGDTLHNQLNTLDSIWSYDLSSPGLTSINTDAQRLVALGRDSESLNYQAENNEPTGLDVSNGAVSVADLPGTGDPGTQSGTRIFFTEQHGRNITYEVVNDDSNHGPGGPGGPGGPPGAHGDGHGKDCKAAKLARKHGHKRAAKRLSKKCK